MSASEFVEIIAQLAGITFVVTSMLAMGLGLTVAQIIEPLRNARLVLLALAANFVMVPLLAFAIARVLSLDDALGTGLIVLASAAGAPFLPKLVQVAKGDVAFGVGLMVLLMIVTIGYMPVVLPLLLPGVSVDPRDIATSLIVLMLVPLAIGLVVRASAPDTAARFQPDLTRSSGVAIVLLMITAVGLNVRNIVDLIGTGGLIALLLFIAGSFAIGLLFGRLGGSTTGASVLGLGTAQRNVSAAIVVTAQNFGGTATLSFVLVGAILLLLILMPLSKRLGAGQAELAA